MLESRLKESGIQHIDVSELVKEKAFYESRDEEYDTHIVDEDALLDYLEPIMVEGGVILDSHMADLWPERWISLVIVLRTNTAPLFDRLTARGYTEAKRECNMECEIMNYVRDEAAEGYADGLVIERPSNTARSLFHELFVIPHTCDSSGCLLDAPLSCRLAPPLTASEDCHFLRTANLCRARHPPPPQSLQDDDMLVNADLVEEYLRNGVVPPSEKAKEACEVDFSDLSSRPDITILSIAEAKALQAAAAAGAKDGDEEDEDADAQSGEE